jgi:hypothetical protein
VKFWGARKPLLTALLLISSSLLFIEPAQANLYAFTSHTFTNCNATGSTGPTQVFCRTAYSTTWDDNNSYFTVSGGIQSWVAPATATYTITAAGATGVGGAKAMSAGAIIRAKVSLTQGSTYKILVGQSGSNGSCGAGGGGGGTFLATSANSPLIVAGGGGGSMPGNQFNNSANGQTTTSGGNASDGSGAGGSSGNGGSGSNAGWGSGGGGFNSNGGTSVRGSSTGGQSFTNGGTGGTSLNQAPGGFGGGGGTHGCTGGGGGGGGYSGGGGSNQTGNSTGGGGGSFIVSGATNIATSNGSYAGSSVGITYLDQYNGAYNSDTYSHGYLTIEIEAVPDTTPPTFTSSSSFSAAENIATSATAATIRVSESATVTISSGADAARFNIARSETNTAIIKFNASPDFEAPADVGGNNVYEITLTATDTAANAGTQSITITVTDVVDTSSFNSLALAGSATTATYRTAIVITANVTVASRITFRVNGKILPGCKNKSTTGSSPNIVATCSWKPSIRGNVSLTAAATPTGAGISSATSTPLSIMVDRRTGSRVA